MTKQEIKRTVNLAIQNVVREGCTDVKIFNYPFELKCLAADVNNKELCTIITEKILSVLNSNRKIDYLDLKKIQFVLVPKKDIWDFRKCALIDIENEILYLSLVLLLAKKVEAKRLNDKIVHSYRYKPNNGKLFDDKKNYTSFRKEYRKLSKQKSYNVMIKCDIANYYDRLSIHKLESTLLSIKGVDLKLVKTINEILLFWSNRNSYGIPVGSNASRILAEAFMIEIDNYLITHKVKFCRFVDDYRIFAKNVTDANVSFTHLVNILNKHGLSINTKKTEIIDISNKNKGTYINSNEKYIGIVPTNFRKLNKKEELLYSKCNLNQKINVLENNTIVYSKDVVECIKILIAKKQYIELARISNILIKIPQLIPYYVDAINKNKDFINLKTRKLLINKIKKLLLNENNPEYISLSLIKAFDSSIRAEKKILFEYYKNIRKNNDGYINRAILNELDGNLERGELLELLDYCSSASIWEKRIIIKMIAENLYVEESRPYMKDYNIMYNDFFISLIIKAFNKNNK